MLRQNSLTISSLTPTCRSSAGHGITLLSCLALGEEKTPLHGATSLPALFFVFFVLFFYFFPTMDLSRLLHAAGAQVLRSPRLSLTCRTEGKVGKEDLHWVQVLPMSYSVTREDPPTQFRGPSCPWLRHFVLF